MIYPSNDDNDLLYQLREELREENERIKSQDLQVKQAFDKYQTDLAKLQKEKQEVRQMKEQLK